MLDRLFQNATLVDGTGTPAYVASIGIQNGKLVLPVAPDAQAKETVDAAGLMICPGFIDAHSHGDLALGQEYIRLSKSSQGITTEICGQCGTSLVPVSGQYLDLGKEVMSVGTLYYPPELPTFTSFQPYLDYAAKVPKTTNFKQLVGHSTLRVAVMGPANRAATAQELEQMKELLKDAMEHGAAGLSTGLIYTPSCYATTDEIVELAKVIAPYGGIYASHIRNESYDSLRAVQEVLEVGRRAGVAVCISHHKILGRSNWGLQKKTLKLIEEAVKEGLSVTCDQYPYTCNMTTLGACMPPWHFDEGMAALAEKLKSPALRQKIRGEMESAETPYDNYYLNAGGWGGVLVASSPNNPSAEGKTVEQYANELGQDPFDTYFDLMVVDQNASVAVYSSMCDEDVFEIALAPNTVVGTDGLVRSMTEKGHPRAFATFPHAINYFVKEHHIMSLEEMIRRMTSMPAQRFHLPTKGVLANGMDADILVIDYDRFVDRATYTNSNALTEGLRYVIVNGEVVLKDQALTGAVPGKFIPHTQQ